MIRIAKRTAVNLSLTANERRNGRGATRFFYPPFCPLASSYSISYGTRDLLATSTREAELTRTSTPRAPDPSTARTLLNISPALVHPPIHRAQPTETMKEKKKKRSNRVGGELPGRFFPGLDWSMREGKGDCQRKREI